MVQRPALSPDRSLALYTNIFGVLPDQAAAFVTKMLHAQLQRGSAAETNGPHRQKKPNTWVAACTQAVGPGPGGQRCRAPLAAPRRPVQGWDCGSAAGRAQGGAR